MNASRYDERLDYQTRDWFENQSKMNEVAMHSFLNKVQKFQNYLDKSTSYLNKMLGIVSSSTTNEQFSQIDTNVLSKQIIALKKLNDFNYDQFK
jgi:hypothetical protein